MKLSDNTERDPRLFAIPDIHGHAKGEHKPYAEERPIPLSARMLFLWFFHACRRGWPRFLMVSDHMNYLTFEDPAAVNLVRRALKLALAGDLYGAAETASVEVGHAAVVSEGLKRGMRFAIGAEVDNDPRARPDAQNIVDAMKPDGMIRSVHFLPITHPVHGENWNWPFDNPEFKDLYDVVGTEQTWEIYMTTLLDAIERLPGNVVGHFYVPAIFGHWPDEAKLEQYEDQVIAACEARGMAIEFNTRFLYRETDEAQKQRMLHAYARLIQKAKDKNVGIAIGSDAHSPRDQGGGFETVLDVLDACDINEIVFPIAGRLARVALKVERKPEPEPEPLPPPAPEPVAEAPVRKARTSESPSRQKTTGSKRDDANPAADIGDTVAPPPKPARKKAAKTEAVAETEPVVAVAATVAVEPPPGKSSAKSTSAKAAPVKAAPAKAVPAKAAKPAAVKAAPAKTTPAKPVKQAAVKAAPAKKAASKAKPAPKPVKKVAAKPAPKPAKKAPPKKAPAKKAAPAKKSPVKKAPPKKAPAAKKPAPKKAAPAKKAPAKKAPAKKPAAKKSAAKRR